ncbi:MAG: hypothetical protein ABJB97_04610, partial [Acidobacteriota bacterium]
MNRREKTPTGARRNFRRSLIALAGVALFSAMTVALVLASGARKELPESTGRLQPAAPQDAPAIKPRSGHSTYLVGLTRKSLREGFGKDSVFVLEPGRGPGRDVVAEQLRKLAAAKRFGSRLTERGLKAAPVDKRNTGFVGQSSVLKVSADGTKFRFRGDIDDQRAIERARSAGRMIEKDELEKIGRRFIGEALREFVKLGPEESLVFLGVKYLRDETLSDEGKVEEEITANVAVFGREVRGVPIIGPGSKVAVWFANDRQPVGFEVDWPVYKVLRSRQETLSRDRLFERVRATSVPVDGSRAAVARFECGYVDLGATRRGAGIQSGCAIQYAQRGDGGELRAR